MQSLIIVSKDHKKGLKHALDICKENKIDSLDITTIKSDKAIGIEEVRTMQKGLILKPFKSQIKAVLIQNAESLTMQAQNAMLKTLEEPPNHTLIILSTTSKELLLSTICSRCRIFELEKEESMSEEEISENLNILTSLVSAGIGERLKIAQDEGKTQESAILWSEKMIIAARKKVIEHLEEDKQVYRYLNVLISIQRSYVTLKTTNANPRLTLETLLLNL